jgi:hypothetical protein
MKVTAISIGTCNNCEDDEHGGIGLGRPKHFSIASIVELPSSFRIPLLLFSSLGESQAFPHRAMC